MGVWRCVNDPGPISCRHQGIGVPLVRAQHDETVSIIAVRAEAMGDITPPRGQFVSEGVAWSHSSGGPYVTSPIAVEKYLYVPLDKGSLTCYEALTGETVYENQELGGRNTVGRTARNGLSVPPEKSNLLS